MTLYLALALALLLGTGSTWACSSPFYSVGSKCVYIDPITTGSWSDMRNYCQDINVRGDLLVISDATFYTNIIHYINDRGWPKQNYWVGGTDEGHEGVWVWVDGSVMKMGSPFWAVTGCDNIFMEPDGQTFQNCALMDGNYYMYMTDRECEFQDAHPICMYI